MNDFKTYREAVLFGAASLKDCGVDSPEYDSRQLMLHAASMDETGYLLKSGDKPLQEQILAFQGLLERRMKREPLQHILGEAYFYGRAYEVNGDVLVPRFDTEVLVENALKVIKDGDSVLDMCTGSGCIIITLALERKLQRAVGCDKSEAALAVARQNAGRLCAGNVSFSQGDLFAALGDEYRAAFDCIVSNPPYIESAEIDALSDEVKKFDPMMALDGGTDGLDFYRKITEKASYYLKNEGFLLYEIGAGQGKAVSELLAQAGFTDVNVFRDLAGLDRVVCGRLSKKV